MSDGNRHSSSRQHCRIDRASEPARDEHSTDFEQPLAECLRTHYPRDGRRASVINTNYPNDVNVEDRDTWPALWEWLVPTMGRLANAIGPVLDRY